MKGNLSKKITRVLAVLLVLVLTFSLFTGCKKNNASPDTVQENPFETQHVEEAEPNNPQESAESEASEEPGGSEGPAEEPVATGDSNPEEVPDKDGFYYTKDEVALYIHVYGHLPDNFMTKKEAKKLGWSGGSLEKYAEGMVIGGDRFGNYEGNLPEKDGRTYTECDIDTLGQKKRGAKRIVFSNDGLIYYTEDHYETFELLYGDENL